MRLKQFFADEDAVSPVIGVILMVAITVILAAVIGTFVLGLGDQINETAPQASFTFDYDADTDDLVITHESGDAISAERLKITSDTIGTYAWDDSLTEVTATTDGSNVAAGNSFTTNTPLDSGEKVRIVWTSESGSTSATVQSWTYNG